MGACVGSLGDSGEVLQQVAADALREAKAAGGDRISFR
jgi:hypothetical protein